MRRALAVTLLLVPIGCGGKASNVIPPGQAEARVHALLAQGRCEDALRVLEQREAELGAHWYVLEAAANTDCFLSRGDPRYKRDAESLLRDGRTKYPASALLLQQGATSYVAFGELALAMRYRTDAESVARKNLASGGSPEEHRDDRIVLEQSGMTIYRTPIVVGEPTTIIIQDGKRIK